jgi:hypothetical protein
LGDKKARADIVLKVNAEEDFQLIQINFRRTVTRRKVRNTNPQFKPALAAARLYP